MFVRFVSGNLRVRHNLRHACVEIVQRFFQERGEIDGGGILLRFEILHDFVKSVGQAAQRCQKVFVGVFALRIDVFGFFLGVLQNLSHYFNKIVQRVLQELFKILGGVVLLSLEFFGDAVQRVGQFFERSQQLSVNHC